MTLFALLLINSSYGFQASGNYWSTSKTAIYVNFDGYTPSGEVWNERFSRAMDSWSQATSFEFISVDSYQDPCNKRSGGGYGDSISSATFGDDICGNAFGANVLAVTLTSGFCFDASCTSGFDINDADIIFNTAKQWDIYEGSRKGDAIDFGRSALHELGHALGLNHEAAARSIMAANIQDIDSLLQDDIDGANYIYGAPDDASQYQSIYGIKINTPKAISTSKSLSLDLVGELAIDDSLVDGRFIDIFEFTLDHDSQIELSIDSSDFKEVLYLVKIDSTQQAIAEHTFFMENTGQAFVRLEQSLPAGTYWIGASSEQGYTVGDYHINLQADYALFDKPYQNYQTDFGATVQVNPNPNIHGDLSLRDYSEEGVRMDIYEFTVSVRSHLTIAMSSAAFDTHLSLAKLNQYGEIDLDSFISHDESHSVSHNHSEGEGEGEGEHSFNITTIESILQPGTYWIMASEEDANAFGAYDINIRAR